MKFLKYSLQFFLVILVSSVFLGTANAMIARYQSPDKPIIVDSLSPQFEIVLNANMTTGYGWTIKQYDQKLLSLVSSNYIPSKSELIGAGGKMVWSFRATPEAFQQKTTETKIMMTYARSWAPNDHPTSVEFKVVFNQKAPEVKIMS